MHRELIGTGARVSGFLIVNEKYERQIVGLKASRKKQTIRLSNAQTFRPKNIETTPGILRIHFFKGSILATLKKDVKEH